jgi:tetratricopeptide (TPR) repeat protein
VVAGGGDALVTGDAVNRAKRLEEAARPGEILLGERTYRLVRDAVRVEPADGAHRLLEVVTDAPAFARRLDAPLVGRRRELRLLRGAFARAAEERACHLFTMLGPAGVGKSRLVEELLARVADRARVLRGRCLPYGEGITFWPVVEMFRDAGAEATLEAALGEATIEETFWAIRKELERFAADRPLVAVFDDVHWAEPTLLDLIENVADWSRDAPILLVSVARPELLDARPGWARGKLNATSLLLEPLSEAESGDLLEHLLPPAELDDAARSTITYAAEGNPLFVEQMVAMVVENGAGELEVPPTIQALVAARIDRLEPAQRKVLECASVEGKVFHRGAVAELAEGTSVERDLMALVRRELIRPEQAEFPGEDAFRFRHLLIRDAAYDSLPKEARTRLHECFADWLARRAGGHMNEYEEILGYHLEQACKYRRELEGDADPALAERAASRLASAGRRALARSDLGAAASLLGRAADLLPRLDPTRAELLLARSRAVSVTGDYRGAIALASEVIEVAQEIGDPRLEWNARTQEVSALWSTDPTLTADAATPVAERAVSVLANLGDEAGVARAWHLVSDVHWLAARWEERAEKLERALEHARRAGERAHEQELLVWLAVSLMFGPTPVDEALRRLHSILADKPSRMVEGAILRFLGGLAAYQGRFDEARALDDRGSAIQQDLGLTAGSSRDRCSSAARLSASPAIRSRRSVT